MVIGWRRSMVAAVAVAGGAVGVGLTAPEPASAADSVSATASFSPASVPLDGATMLTVTVTAPSGATGPVPLYLSGSGPFGIAMTPGTSTACGGTLSVTQVDDENVAFSDGPVYQLELSNASVSPTVPCTFTVPATGDAAGTPHFSIEYGSGDTAGPPTQALLTVAPSELPPRVSLTMSSSRIAPGQNSSMTLTLTNPNAQSLSYVSAVVAAPFGLVNDPGYASTCGGTFIQTGDSPGEPEFDYEDRLAAVTLAPGASCQLTAPWSASMYAMLESGTMQVTADSREGGSAVASAPIAIVPAPAPRLVGSLRLAPAAVRVGQSATAVIQLRNRGSATATELGFARTLPAGLALTRARVHGAAAGNTCGGRVASRGRQLTLSGGQLRAGGACRVTVGLSSAHAGHTAVSTGPIRAGGVVVGRGVSATLAVRPRS